MTGYRPSLWDNSEPDYAPGLLRNGPRAYWRPAKRFVDLGYPKDLIPVDGDVAKKCRAYTRKMLKHFKQDGWSYGTWGWLLARYRTDRHSPIRKVKENTLENYLWLLQRLDAAIGDQKMSECHHAEVMGWLSKMEDDGRSVSYIKRAFTMIRTVVSYGCMIEDKEALRISEILSRVRIKNPPPRSVAPTPEQIEAIVREADKAGLHSFATGLLMQWWFALRAVDVRGIWVKGSGPIQRNGQRWQDGATWEMVDEYVTKMTKVPSKTRHAMPEPLVFPISAVPELRLRLLQMQDRTGPIFKNAQGWPYTEAAWQEAFRQCRDKAGVPKHIQMMDTRAGAITHAAAMGADPIATRDAGQHKNLSTSSRYLRARSANISNVITLRRANAD